MKVLQIKVQMFIETSGKCAMHYDKETNLAKCVTDTG